MTPEEKRLEAHYQRNFGWSLAEVDAMFTAQKNVCAFCHRPAGKHRLSVDHDRAWDRVVVTVHKLTSGFYACAKGLDGEIYGEIAPTRKKVRQQLKIKLRQRSVRQGLCLRCNKALALLEDSKAPLSTIERLENAIKCLKVYHAKIHPLILVDS